VRIEGKRSVQRLEVKKKRPFQKQKSRSQNLANLGPEPKTIPEGHHVVKEPALSRWRDSFLSGEGPFTQIHMEGKRAEKAGLKRIDENVKGHLQTANSHSAKPIEGRRNKQGDRNG